MEAVSGYLQIIKTIPAIDIKVVSCSLIMFYGLLIKILPHLLDLEYRDFWLLLKDRKQEVNMYPIQEKGFLHKYNICEFIKISQRNFVFHKYFYTYFRNKINISLATNIWWAVFIQKKKKYGYIIPYF